jgi:hypothetical protein
MRILALLSVVIAAFLAGGCGNESRVARPDTNRAEVLLSDEFDSPVDPARWEVLDSCDSLSRIDGTGCFKLISCSSPTYVGSGLVSRAEWSIDEEHEYHLSFRIRTPNCLGDGAVTWGIICSDSGPDAAIAFYSPLYDVYSVYLGVRESCGSCSLLTPLGQDVCEEVHDYKIIASDTGVQFLVDGELVRTAGDGENDCMTDLSSFKVGVTVSSHTVANWILVESVRVERFKKNHST